MIPYNLWIIENDVLTRDGLKLYFCGNDCFEQVIYCKLINPVLNNNNLFMLHVSYNACDATQFRQEMENQ